MKIILHVKNRTENVLKTTKQHKQIQTKTSQAGATRFWCSNLICSHPSFHVFILAAGLVQSVPSVAGRCTPATGCGGLGAASTTWPASPASPARGSCPPGRSSAWWRAGCSAEATMTSCWTTSGGLQKTVPPDFALDLSDPSIHPSRFTRILFTLQLMQIQFCTVKMWSEVTSVFLERHGADPGRCSSVWPGLSAEAS